MRANLTVETGEAYPLRLDIHGPDVVTLGRNRGNTIVLNDRHASRWHAEIVPEHDGWVLRDCGTTNGTKLDGEKLARPTPLSDGREIRIGDTCLRFRVVLGDEHCTDEVHADPVSHIVENDLDHTALQPDELTAIFSFMDGSLKEATPQGLVTLALNSVHRQTGADVCGFLSLEIEDPLPKIVVPDRSRVDTHLSRELTQRVQSEGKSVWLAASQSNALQADSLVSYRDALCVPVQGSEGPLGALHFYRYGQAFTERQVRFCEVLAGYLYRCLHGQRTRRALEAENSRLSVNTASGGQELIGTTAIMKQLRQQIGKLANGPRVVMVCGESGSGKELVALALHNESSRREGPLVAVNCAAIAASMPEAELFGHCRGSFTGADRDRPGYFQQADMGTLFLDEIGELSEEIQAKLLRVLEERKFRPVGAKAEVKADVRIVAATNRDLQRECAEGRFRQDLFYRLAVVELRVPPLREHREDIPALVQHFLGRLSVEYKRTVRLTDDAMRRLQAYHWPGNVRQLRSVLEHAVAMAEGPVVDADELHLVGDGPPAVPEGMSLNLRQLEAWAIRQALQQTGGVMVQAARLLGIHRDTLAEKMKQYGIDKHDRA